MRRALVLVRQLCSHTRPGCAAAARSLESSLIAASSCSKEPIRVVAVVRQELWGRRGFSAATGGGSSSLGGSGSNSEQPSSAAWEAVTRLSAEATEMAEEGDADGAKKMLKRELPALVAEFGAEDPSVGLIFNQLAMWQFYDGEYADAVEAAQAAHKVWMKELGADSQAAAFHGIRLGMALAAAGKPEEAFPLLERGLTVAVDNYNHHVAQLESLQPMAEDSEAAAERATEKDEEIMAARAQQQMTAVAMLEKLGRALQEAKFYRSLSFIGVTGRELNDKWDDNGAGATFFLEQEMSDAVTDMLRWVMPDHPTVLSALREHSRLMDKCEEQGLRRLHDDLQIHNQRLRDVIQDATQAKDG